MSVGRRGAALAAALGLCALLISPAAVRAGRKGRPPSYADGVMFQATNSVIVSGQDPTPENVRARAEAILDDVDAGAREKAKAGTTSAAAQAAQGKRNEGARSEVRARTKEAGRRHRGTVVERVWRVITAPLKPPLKLAGEIRERVEKILPPFFRPIFRVVVGQYVGRRYDTLLRTVFSKFATKDAVRAFDVWRKILPYKDNPALAPAELRQRLKDLTRGKLGEVLDKIVQEGLKRFGKDPKLRELFVARMEHLRESLEKRAGREIDELFDKKDKEFKKRLEELTRELTDKVPDRRVRQRIEKMAADTRARFQEMVSGEKPRPELSKASPVQAVISANPTSGPPPLSVAFNGGGSVGKVRHYSWDFGDGEKDGGVATSHTYRSKGNYVAKLTVYDDRDHSSTATVKIAVKPEGPPPKLKVGVTVSPKKAKPGDQVQVEVKTVVEGAEKGSYTVAADVGGEEILRTTHVLGVSPEPDTIAYEVPKDAAPGTRTVKASVVLEPTDESGGEGKPVKAAASATFVVERPKEEKAPAKDLSAWLGTWEEEGASFTHRLIITQAGGALAVKQTIDAKTRDGAGTFSQKYDFRFTVDGTTAKSAGRGPRGGGTHVWDYTLRISGDGRIIDAAFTGSFAYTSGTYPENKRYRFRKVR